MLLGIGRAESARFAPAGLLVEYGHARVGLDGGPGSEPPENVDAWLIRDEHDPLLPDLRKLATQEGMCQPAVTSFKHGPLRIEAHEVTCADHTMYGYRIVAGRRSAVWAPEFTAFPKWARSADMVFADAADVSTTAAAAQRLGVGRLIFARIGEPVFAEIDAGNAPPFGEWGDEGRTYRM